MSMLAGTFGFLVGASLILSFFVATFAIDYIDERIEELENNMLEAADNLDFELAATLRDEISALQNGGAPKKQKTKRRKR